MGEIGPEKLLLLLVIILLLFGAKRLPEIGQSLGKGIREFKRSVNDMGASHTADNTVDRAADVQRERFERPPAPNIERGEVQAAEPKRLLE
jgi:sec-independent protein translocase protein TatA